MQGNLSESLPDFDDMNKIAKFIASSKAKLEDAKNQLEEKIADCIHQALTNQDYWLDNKPPTMSYCTSVISVRGNNEDDFKELKRLRESIIEYNRSYQEARSILDNMKDRISVWQTHSANTRKANM